MPQSNRRDNQYIQSSLFGEELVEEIVDDKLRERQIREEVEIDAQSPVLTQFPPLIIPYRWERLKAEADKRKISLKPIIMPVYPAIAEVEEQLLRIRETGMGRLLIISGVSGSGKTTFLNSLSNFIDEVTVHNLRIMTVDSIETVETALSSVDRDNDDYSIVVLEGKETPDSLSSEEIDKLLTTLNTDFRRDSGYKTLFVIPTPSQAVAQAISSRAATVGKMTSPNKPYLTFSGPARSEYISITNDTLRALNSSRTLLNYGIDEQTSRGIAEASESIGAFMENCYEEIQRERKRQKSFSLNIKRKRIHLWMVFCTAEEASRTNHDIIRSLSLSNSQYVQIDRMMTGDSQFVRFWEDKQGKFARAAEYLDLRVTYLPMRTANAAFIAYGSSSMIKHLEDFNLISRQATSRQSAQDSLGGTAIWSFFNRQSFVDRNITKRNPPSDEDRGRFRAVLEFFNNNDKALNRVLADVLRDLIKDPEIKVATELSLVENRSLISDIAIVSPTDIYCLEIKWRSSRLQDNEIVKSTLSRVKEFATELQDLKAWLGI